MFHIHTQNQSQNLSNSLNCTYHSRTLIFLFFLPLSHSGVIVYLGSHRMVSTAGLGGNNFLPTDLPSLLHSHLLPQNLLLSGLAQTAYRRGIVVPIQTILMMIYCFGVDYLAPLGGGWLPVFVGSSQLVFHLNKGGC